MVEASRCLVIAMLLALAPAASAQLSQPGAEQSPLTDEAPPDVSTSSGPFCGQPEVHGIAEPGEVPEQEGKAYTSTSSVAVGCPTLFRGPVPGAFNLSAAPSVHLFIGCDDPTAMHEPLNNVRVWLTRNEQVLTEAGGQLGPTCTPGEPMELELALDQPEDPRFNGTDTIGLNVTVFGSPNAAVDNLHVLVGGDASASTVTLPGLSEAFEPEEEDVPVEEDNGTEEASNLSDLDPQSTDEGTDGIPGPGAGLLAGLLGALALAFRRRRST